MNCPHCEKELPSKICGNCNKEVLEEATFCHHCGKSLADQALEITLDTCPSCASEVMPDFEYCHKCGANLSMESDEDQNLEETGFDPTKRIAWSDGLCIGIIGPDGKCTECGKPYNPQESEDNDTPEIAETAEPEKTDEVAENAESDNEAKPSQDADQGKKAEAKD